MALSSNVDPDDDLVLRAETRVGQVLCGKWTLKRVIGVGGMATVYAAEHRNGKRGAVKIMHPELTLLPGARARFLREGYAANSVDHEGVVSVLDDDTAEDGAVYLVMELLDGASLSAIAESRPGAKLAVGEVVAIGDQLLEVLLAAHDKGILHRDLKPENLFVTKAGRLKILDFGLARVRELQGGGQRATRTGTSMGTPAFMPPEQAVGNWDAVDARTDLWAVGATLFCLLTGRVVHQEQTIAQLLVAVMTKPAPRTRAVEPAVPEALAAVVDRALEFEPANRWPSAHEMRQALRAAYPDIPALTGILGTPGGQGTMADAPGSVGSVPDGVRGASTSHQGPSLSAPGANATLEPSTPRMERKAATLASAPEPSPPSSSEGFDQATRKFVPSPEAVGLAERAAAARALAPAWPGAPAAGALPQASALHAPTAPSAPAFPATTAPSAPAFPAATAPSTPAFPAASVSAPVMPPPAQWPAAVASGSRLGMRSEPFTQIMPAAPRRSPVAAIAAGVGVLLAAGAIVIWLSVGRATPQPSAPASPETAVSAARPDEPAAPEPAASGSALTSADPAASGAPPPEGAGSATAPAPSDSASAAPSSARPTPTPAPSHGKSKKKGGTYSW